MRFGIFGLVIAVGSSFIHPLRADDAVSQTKANSQPRVVIVGAGLAGMAAAFELMSRHGIASEVYEARDRVGGRTWSVSEVVGSRRYGVEMGGGFINSTDASLRDLMKRLELPEVKSPSRDDVQYLLRDESGAYHIRRDKEVFERFGAFFSAIDTRQRELGIHRFKFMNGMNEEAKRLDFLSIAAYLKSLHISDDREFTELVGSYFGANFGRSLEDLSALHLLAGISIDLKKRDFEFLDDAVADGALAVEGGNQRVCLEIERRLGNVHKEHILKAIESRDRKRFKLTFERRGIPGVTIVDADYLVAAVPFAVLRDSVSLRIDGFPESTQAAISSEIPGRNSKMILTFKQPFWKTNFGHSGSLTTSEFMTWPNNENKPEEPGILTIYFYSKQEYARDDLVRDHALEVLDHVYPGIRKEPATARFADWPNDPFSRGSFSRAKAPGHWKDGWPTVEGMRVGNLWFAGSHVAGDLALTGYMNGAVVTGVEAAAAIAESMKEGAASLK